MTEQELVDQVETTAQALCNAMHAAVEGGVSQALLLPALVSVFREAGMIPDSLDMGSLMGMLK